MNTSPYPPIGQTLAASSATQRDMTFMRARFHPGRLVGRWLGGWLFLLVYCATLPAQTPPPAQSSIVPAKLTAQELSQLLSPIALYPDALIALILPASTVPSDVVLGARYLANSGDPAQVESRAWDDSVKSLVRYPDVLAWMDQNLDWTASVGEAFLSQPAEVMNAIQALRSQARAAGTLVDTPQQKIVQEEEYIRIIPADPEIIYVPQYDPQIVYVQSYTPALVTFGVGFAVGSWLNYDFDWRQRCIYRGQWRGWDRGWNNNWRGGVGNSVNVVNINVNNVSRWQPSPASVRQVSQRQRHNNGNARIVNARSQQLPPGRTANLPSGAQFDPNRSSAVPRPSRLNAENERRGRGEQPGRPTGTSAAVRGLPQQAPSSEPGVRADRPPGRTSAGQPGRPLPGPAGTPGAAPSAHQVPSGGGRQFGQRPSQGEEPRSQQPRPRTQAPQGTVTQGSEVKPPEARRGPNQGQPSRHPVSPATPPQVGIGTPRTPQGQMQERPSRPERPARPTTTPSQPAPPTAPAQRPSRSEAPRISQPPREPRQQPQQRPPQIAPRQIQAPQQQAPQQRQFQQQRTQRQEAPRQAPQQRPERMRPQMPEARQMTPPQGSQTQVPQSRGGQFMGGGQGHGEGRGGRQQPAQQ